jgi:hypothetical protein
MSEAQSCWITKGSTAKPAEIEARKKISKGSSPGPSEFVRDEESWYLIDWEG